MEEADPDNPSDARQISHKHNIAMDGRTDLEHCSSKEDSSEYNTNN